MADWETVLEGLETQHAEALRWFARNAGETISWSAIQRHEETSSRLAISPRGIYKPEYTSCSLSVKQTLSGPYDDKAIEERSDGSWLYLYHQQAKDDDVGNLGLQLCMQHEIPVGVLIQTKGKPGVEYLVQGLARVVDWRDGYFYLEGYTTTGSKPDVSQRSDAARAIARVIANAQHEDPFDPANQQDKRERTIAEIVRRRGQAKFRRELLSAYGRRCAITGCDATEALEAAHISPYLGDATNHPQNGILLRADLHSLFDLGLVGVEPTAMSVRLAPSLFGTTYEKLHGHRIKLPSESALQPSAEALTQHLRWAGLDQQ